MVYLSPYKFQDAIVKAQVWDYYNPLLTQSLGEYALQNERLKTLKTLEPVIGLKFEGFEKSDELPVLTPVCEVKETLDYLVKVAGCEAFTKARDLSPQEESDLTESQKLETIGESNDTKRN